MSFKNIHIPFQETYFSAEASCAEAEKNCFGVFDFANKNAKLSLSTSYIWLFADCLRGSCYRRIKGEKKVNKTWLGNVVRKPLLCVSQTYRCASCLYCTWSLYTWTVIIQWHFIVTGIFNETNLIFQEKPVYKEEKKVLKKIIVPLEQLGMTLRTTKYDPTRQ